MQAETPIPWLHIAEVLAAEALRHGYHRVGVLGTRYTMEGPVYRDALRTVGVDAGVPTEPEMELVDRVIFDELVNGVFADESRAAYYDIIARLRDSGCDAVALACTEIPLLVRADESPLPVLDSTALLARAAVEYALAD